MLDLKLSRRNRPWAARPTCPRPSSAKFEPEVVQVGFDSNLSRILVMLRSGPEGRCESLRWGCARAMWPGGHLRRHVSTLARSRFVSDEVWGRDSGVIACRITGVSFGVYRGFVGAYLGLILGLSKPSRGLSNPSRGLSGAPFGGLSNPQRPSRGGPPADHAGGHGYRAFALRAGSGGSELVRT